MTRGLRNYWPVIAITCVGAVLRFTNVNWDAGGRLHPDEALIVNGALTVKFFSGMFPGFHDYNGFSVYLLKIVSLGVSFLSRNSYWSGTPEGVTLVGRYISMTISALSIPLMYVLGKRLWKKETGIIAAIFFAFTPLVSQLAHFYTTEGILIFLLLVLLYATHRYTQKQDIHSLIRMAIPSGLLLATKNTSYLFLPLPLITLWSFVLPVRKKASSLFLFLVIVFVVFFVASPYSFIDLPGYIARSRYLTQVVSGRLLMDWTMQFQETNGLFWVKNLLYALGPLFLLGLVGVTGSLLRQKSYRNIETIYAVWTVGFSVFLSFTYLKFTRYAAPLIPALTLFAAKFLMDIRKTRAGIPVLFCALGLQVLSGLMYFSIPANTHTSIVAAEWIHNHIPPESVILVEEWNSIVRFTGPELSANRYQLISFNFYTLADNETKKQNLEAALLRADYIMLESPKVKNTVTRLAPRYPYSSQFYEQLTKGARGFTKVAEFASYPRLGPITLSDVNAEETFTVFDHPTITIYQKNQAWQ